MLFFISFLFGILNATKQDIRKGKNKDNTIYGKELSKTGWKPVKHVILSSEGSISEKPVDKHTYDKAMDKLEKDVTGETAN